MDVVALTQTDCALLTARYAAHGNSHRRMRTALLANGAADSVARLDALRAVERAFDLDLGLVCHLYEHHADDDAHPIAKLVAEFITDVRSNASGSTPGGELLWVLPDRVRQVRELMQEHVVGERE
jgi:hypothetical protein